MFRKLCVFCVTATFAFAIACADKAQSPTSPTAGPLAPADAAADGSTLKATAPALVAPANGSRLTDFRVTLVVGPSSGTHAPLSAGVGYEFQVLDASGTVVESSGTLQPTGGNVSYAVQRQLDVDRTYRWRARAILDGQAGPWTEASFLTPQFPEPYIRGSELYDPLWPGKTAAEVVHEASFVPNQGIRLHGQTSYVQWRIATLTEGEFSLEARNIRNSDEEWKTKIMSMLDLAGINITENAYRVTIDKRSDWLGQGSRVRFTMRSRGIDAGEPRGDGQIWNPNTWYFWKFEWRGGTATLTVRDGGPNGPVKELISTHYAAPYAPPVHGIRLGSVGGRNIPESLPNVIVRNVYVGAGSRPDFPPVPAQ
jgi:hypothetical protein